MAVVVVEFLAHVERAIGQCVVEQAERDFGRLLPGQVERDVFVERVGRARAVAHRIDVAHAVALPQAVGIAGAFPKAEVHFVGLAFQVVVHLVVPPGKVVGLRRTVRCNADPCLAVTDFPATEEAGAGDGQTDLCGDDRNLVGVFFESIGG